MDNKTKAELRNLSFQLVTHDVDTHYKTGSQVVKSVKPNDYDYVIYESKEYGEPIRKYLNDNDYEIDAGEHYKSLEENSGGNFESFRKEKLNVIYTNDKDFYDRYVAATIMVEKKQPKDKKDRIAIFEAIFTKEESERFKNIMAERSFNEAYHKSFGTSVGSTTFAYTIPTTATPSGFSAEDLKACITAKYRTRVKAGK